MSEALSLLGQDLEAYRAKEGMEEAASIGEEPAKRLKAIDRNQTFLRPIDVEKLVDEDHAVRGIWAMVNRLDLKQVERSIKAVEGHAGQSSLDPRLLMSLWIYAYSQGISSARELSRMCDYEPGCQWLTGMQSVNHHTLSDFRVAHELDEIFVQVLGLLSAEGLIELTRVMQDGTKVRANAKGGSFRRGKRIREHLKLARKQVAAMDSPDGEERSQRVIEARRRAIREKQERLEQALRELETLQKSRKPSEQEQVRVSETDPESRIMKQSDGGFRPSYNVQISTEASHGIIMAVDVTQQGTDYDLLVEGIDRVEANAGQAPAQVVVDGGFIKNANIESMAARGIDLIGPIRESNKEASFEQRGVEREFYPDRFQYDPTDRFMCPAGKTLIYKRTAHREGRIEHSYQASRRDCEACPFRDQCCPKNAGRIILRREDSGAVKAFRARMQTEEAKQIYRTRAQIAEFPNAWIKEKLRLRQFRLRGRAKVRLEAIWACLTYNIQQWMRLVWRPPLQAIA
jgi:transposase